MHAGTVDRGPLYRAGNVDASGRAAAATVKSAATDWRERAACRDADIKLFFPKPGQDSRAARRICRGCPVQPQCLEYVLRTQTSYRDDHGIFADTTREDRRRIRAARRAATRPTRPSTPTAPSAGRPGRPTRAAGGQPSRRGTRFLHDRAAAVEAWELAKRVGINEAARQLLPGTTSPSSLYRAWRRWDLGVPDTSGSTERWARQLGTGSRQATFRALERRRLLPTAARARNSSEQRAARVA
jgi:WhiB family transcriptional regulator, redox-sensing transcriptional regulator